MSSYVVTLGAHVLDILGRYVTHIPEGQGSVLLDEIRLAPAGFPAGAPGGPAELGPEGATGGPVGGAARWQVVTPAPNRCRLHTTRLIRQSGVQEPAVV